MWRSSASSTLLDGGGFMTTTTTDHNDDNDHHNSEVKIPRRFMFGMSRKIHNATYSGGSCSQRGGGGSVAFANHPLYPHPQNEVEALHRRASPQELALQRTKKKKLILKKALQVAYDESAAGAGDHSVLHHHHLHVLSDADSNSCSSSSLLLSASDNTTTGRTEIESTTGTDTGAGSTRSSAWNHHHHHHKEDSRQMKVEFHQFSASPFDVMQIQQDHAMIAPQKPSHVVIRVQASSVTLNDCLLRRGLDFNLINPATLPMTPGHDVVGTIAAVGSQVQLKGEFKPGDRVAALIRVGGNARYASVPEASLVRVPFTVNAAEAACMVSVYSAAYQSLKMVTRSSGSNTNNSTGKNHTTTTTTNNNNNREPQRSTSTSSSSPSSIQSLRDKKILVIGGMSDIGQAVIQMCVKARANVFATAPLSRHAYMISTLGALPLPEDAHDWLPLVEGAMDVVFDGQCADGLLAAKKAVVKKGSGNVIWFGYSSMIKEEMGLFGPPIKAHINRMMAFSVKNVDIWDHFQKDPVSYKKQLVSLFQLLKWNKLRPFIAKRITLADVPFAHVKLETGEVRGCVVCMPWKCKRVEPPQRLQQRPSPRVSSSINIQLNQEQDSSSLHLLQPINVNESSEFELVIQENEREKDQFIQAVMYKQRKVRHSGRREI